jgi:hypothetical protein
MRKHCLNVIKIVFFLSLQGIFLCSCEKKTPKEVEEAIKFETDAIDQNICNADKFIFTTKLLSKMPSNGIKLSITAKEEISNTDLPQDPPLVSNGSQTAMNVKGLPKQKWVIATVKVCSAKDTLNCVSKSFKIVFK